MRTIFAYLALSFLISSCARTTVDRLFTEYKKNDGVIAATIPGWIIEKGMHYALKDEGSEVVQQVQDVVRDIKKLRVLVVTDKTKAVHTRNVNQEMRNDSYQLYAMVNDKSNKFNVWVKEQQESIEDLFLYVDAEDAVVLIQVKGDINMAALDKVDL